MSGEDQTKKYVYMIESLECGFALAVEDGRKHGLYKLQVKIYKGHKKFLSDIKLLQELSYGLKNGKLKIIAVQNGEDQTKKYASMIESFGYDFALAIEDGTKYGLDKLQARIKQGDEKLLSDIELLGELSCELRYERLKIVAKSSREAIHQERNTGGCDMLEKFLAKSRL